MAPLSLSLIPVQGDYNIYFPLQAIFILYYSYRDAWVYPYTTYFCILPEIHPPTMVS